MDLLTTTASQWQEALISQNVTSVELIDLCLAQIDKHNYKGQSLHAVISVAPRENLISQAKTLDAERSSGKIRSPMHGIPLLLKDIFPTARGLGMPTTCGAYALRSAYGKENCPLVQTLLDAGMIIIGKTNLNEYTRLTDAKAATSMLGGQTQSAYIQDGTDPDDSVVGNSKPSGSSSGSAVGVSAGFAPVSIGTETTGSLVHPAHRAGLYSLKITNDRAPKEGSLILAKEFDSLGPMVKSVEDLRAMMAILMGRKNVERGGREGKLKVGFVDARKWRFPDEYCRLGDEIREEVGTRYDGMVEALSSNADFQVVANIPLEQGAIQYDDRSIVGSVVEAQFRENFAAFAACLEGTDIKTLSDLIAYNSEDADQALPDASDEQKALHRANDNNEPPEFLTTAVQHGRQIAGPGRLEKAMQECDIDLIVGPGDSELFAVAACAGYPIGSVPWTTIKFNERDSRPEGLLVVAKTDEEDSIMDFMEAWEKAFPWRPLPEPLVEKT